MGSPTNKFSGVLLLQQLIPEYRRVKAQAKLGALSHNTIQVGDGVAGRGPVGEGRRGSNCTFSEMLY